MATYSIEQNRLAHFLFLDARSAPLWLAVRLYVGWEWLSAGWAKVTSPLWIGADAGQPLIGFVTNALAKTAGAHPDVQGWYASFLTDVVLPNATVFSHFVAFGEVLVGIALIAGFLVGISAFFGVFMNLNFLLAGAVSINPFLLVAGIFLILARRVAGRIGFDRFVLPILKRLSIFR